METKWLLNIIIPLLTGILGFCVAIFLKKVDLINEISKKIFGDKIDKIITFTESKGLLNILKYFESVNADDLDKNLNKISTFNLSLEKQERKLNELDQSINNRLFNRIIGQIHSNIESNRKFIERLEEYGDSKKYLMNYITNFQVVRDVLDTQNSIFIESGSTLAYCILNIIKEIKTIRENFETRPLRVCTNNISIFMLLLFERYFIPKLLPGNPSGDPYGATYAIVGADTEVNTELVNAFLIENEVTAFFTTSSYVDITYGPHVSSKNNYSIKRILNEYAVQHNHINIHVIVSEKINEDVTEKKIAPKCKLIFDANCTENIINNEKVLNDTKRAWEKHIDNENNYIISASDKRVICDDISRKFIQKHPTIHQLPLECAVQFYKRTSHVIR